MNVDPASRSQRSFAAVVASARDARAFVAERLREEGVPTPVLADLQLVVSELVANAIQHGSNDVVVQVGAADGSWVELEVVGGSGLPAHLADPASWRIADASDATGRGLGIVRELVDEVVLDHIEGQLVVRCRRRRTSGDV